jgi:hypothetical protein
MGFSHNPKLAIGAKAQKSDFTAYPPAKAGGNSWASSLRFKHIQPHKSMLFFHN